MMGTDISMALALASVTVGWSLIAFRVVRRFFSTLERFRMGQPLLDKRSDVFE
jgi:TRAP-type C4-dicarboxylate transport system permease small subunit